MPVQTLSSELHKILCDCRVHVNWSSRNERVWCNLSCRDYKQNENGSSFTVCLKFGHFRCCRLCKHNFFFPQLFYHVCCQPHSRYSYKELVFVQVNSIRVRVLGNILHTQWKSKRKHILYFLTIFGFLMLQSRIKFPIFLCHIHSRPNR